LDKERFIMASDVYFSDLRAGHRQNLLDKIKTLLDKVDLESKIKEKDLVAIKLHFGEKGNTSFIRPLYFRPIVERARELGGNPFLTDANTLYVGTRSDSVSHLTTAVENGFSFATVGAPILIADGLRGGSFRDVNIEGNLFKSVAVAADIAEADVLISAAHFKGHELSGFGGAIKNVGMGAAARKGKLAQHSDLAPKVKSKKCIGCGDCVEHCSQHAISLVKKKSFIDPVKCIGCGECILICPEGAIDIQWNGDADDFQKKMVEYTKGVLRGKEKKSVFINFLTQISPACDCYGHCDAPIVSDIGILASTDPVAIDQASVDLVNRGTPLAASCIGDNCGPDKFRAIYPKIDWNVQLDYGQEMGLGVKEYNLIPLESSSRK
jgi:uncharacterized protein